MTTATYGYRPDYAVAPGSVLAERLAAHGLSQAELARRCGRSPKLISDIIAGKASLEPETALQLERVLAVGAHIWLGMESDYRLHRTRLADDERIQDSVAWVRRFPVKEMGKRRLIAVTTGKGSVSELLSFFGVASVSAWKDRYGKVAVAYRHSPSFESNRDAFAVWHRTVEVRAAKQECAEYDKKAFYESLMGIRQLTRTWSPGALPKSQALCNSAGVALAVVKPFSGMRLSGAAWWPSARNPVIALTARHKTDDQLWFSMFHEAAHILLHGKRRVFIDEPRGSDDAMEDEANRWAANFLIPQPMWRQFVGQEDLGCDAVRRFADDQGIPPGIVVGRLQHEKRVPWNSNLNSLKTKLRWSDERGRS